MKKTNRVEYSNYKRMVREINSVKFDELDKERFTSKTIELREKVLNEDLLEEVIIEAFALVKEAVKETLKIVAYDEQLIASIAMSRGRVVEMQTGEGKTLVAVFTAYLNALSGVGCHILTFNDYLAKRDALWMGPVYDILGLKVAYVQDNMSIEEKQKAYASDITYVTAKVAGFDYLRDSLCYNKRELMQPELSFAIIDEADSIIIDEARIPLVIATGEYYDDDTINSTMDKIKMLKPEVDYYKDEREINACLTEKGLKRMEDMLSCDNLYAEENFKLLNEVHNALHAEVLLKLDIDYIIRDGKIEMVDELTGRVADNRHWPDGIQGAIEAKEGLAFKSKGRIMNKITIHNFILLYKKVAGMTGTAVDSSEEIREFYDMEVLVIPPHVPCKRVDYPDVIFTHKVAKYKALIAEIIKVNSTGQPILIGTSDIKESEYLAKELESAAIKCKVLNAKNDELETKIIEKAGELGAITVSTNMAGRGVDIKLGGINHSNREKIIELGGLYVIGTSRYESIRIDKQLRGRSGRQGDIGMSRFYISLEDNLVKKYGIDNLIPPIFRPKEQDQPIEDLKIAGKIQQVQRIVQGKYSDLRRALWEYSCVVEMHRLHVYTRRMEILKDNLPFNILRIEELNMYQKLVFLFNQDTIDSMEKQCSLYNLDNNWAIYLSEVTNIEEGVNLRRLGGKNPLREFHMETNKLFDEIEQTIKNDIVRDFLNLDVSEEAVNALMERIKSPSATWTYLANDNALVDSLSLMLVGSGGSTAIVGVGMIVGIPILYATLFLKKAYANLKGIFRGRP